jgi:FkbM family methyltransferase
MTGQVSYSQRHEDINLLRALGEEQTSGFYIDIGAGHPVFDNVSFAFYLKGWSGIAVEPNPRLAALARSIRPRDRNVQVLVGARNGEADFYLVDDFHGFSTTVEAHARSARSDFGKASQTMRLPMVTLAGLCAGHGAGEIDFLKIDVEGAEAEVLAGNDWDRFRPKIVLVEALAPFSQAPAWEQWEPMLLTNGYRYVLFDSLNRYYVREDAPDVAARLAAASSGDGVALFRDFGPPIHDPAHPDHALALLLEKPVLARLPLLDTASLADLLTADLPASVLDRAATEADLALAEKRLFGPGGKAPPGLPAGMTVRELYRALAGTDAFRAALGRISASCAW